MEPKLIQLERQSRVKVRISLTTVPFGKLKVKETYNFPKQEREATRTSYSFPTETAFTRVVTASQPLVVITPAKPLVCIIVRLIGQVITVSLETVKIVNSLPELNLE